MKLKGDSFEKYLMIYANYKPSKKNALTYMNDQKRENYKKLL